jgi:photosystem II stability/assembly factor-like uncharacterized protein
MKNRIFRILAAAVVALLPACGGGNGSGGSSAPATGGGAGNPAFPVTMTEPSAGQTFTAPATISLSAVVADPASVAKVMFVEGAVPGPDPSTWVGGNFVAMSTQPPFHATWADVTAGIHTLVAVATDSQGAQTFSNAVPISVLAPGESSGGWVPVAIVWGPGPFWFVDADRGWVAGVGAILHTEDGGTTWVVQLAVPPSVPLNDIQFIDANRGWVLSDDGTVLRTTDGGATWTSSSTSSDGSALSFVDPDTGWVVGGLGGNVLVTKDGGVTWTPLPTGIPGIEHIDAVHFVDPRNGWVRGVVQSQSPEDGSPVFPSVILHTTDGGMTWTEQLRTTIFIGAGEDESFSAMDFVSATTGWVSSSQGHHPSNGKIFFTNDGGSTWTEQSSIGGTDPISIGGIGILDFVSPTQGWGVAGQILHTEDGGRSWVTQQQNTSSPEFRIVDVHFIDAHRGWAMCANGTLFKTTTGGKAP